MWDELTEQEQRTIWDTYTQFNTARTPFEKLTRSEKNSLAYEAVRQLVQQKATGEITESAVSKIFNRAMGKPESAWAKFIDAIARFYESWSPAKGSKLEARANAAMELTGRAPVTTHAPSLDVAITKKRASELEALYSVFMEDNGISVERKSDTSPWMLKDGNAESLSQLAKRIREDFSEESGIESAQDGRTRRTMNNLAKVLEKKAAELKDSESQIDSDNVPFAPKLPSKEAAMGQLDLLFTDAELSQQAEEGAAIIADENKRQADERQKQEAELRNEYKDEIFEAPRSDVDELLTEQVKIDLYEYVIGIVSGGRGDFASVNRMVRNSKAAAMLPTAFLQEQAETFVYTRALNRLAKMAKEDKLDLYDGAYEANAFFPLRIYPEQSRQWPVRELHRMGSRERTHRVIAAFTARQ